MQAATRSVADGDMAKALKAAYQKEMQMAVENKVLEAAKQIEAHTDNKLREMDEMSSDELERIREKQIARLKKQASRNSKWTRQGHGSYDEIEERDFFQHAHRSSRIVLHFCRPQTERCALLDKHLHALAERHCETRFVKLNAEKAPFLAARLKIKMLPTLVLFKDGVQLHRMIGFEEVGGVDTFKTAALEAALARHKIIRGREPGQGLPDEELSGADERDSRGDDSSD